MELLVRTRSVEKIKSSNSIPHLIDFLKKIEDGDYWEAGEEAMFALTAIGTPAMEPLLKAVKEMLASKKCDSYLMEALTEIKDERVYEFMVSVLESYEKNPEKYDGWFEVYVWCWDFVEQENKGVLPLLRSVLSMPQLTKQQRLEIGDTIEHLEDPEGWERKVNELGLFSHFRGVS